LQQQTYEGVALMAQPPALSLSRKIRARLNHLRRGLFLVWTPAPGWTTLWGSLLVVQGVLPVATVHLTRLLVDGLVHSMSGNGNWESFRPVVILAVLLGVTLLLTELLQTGIEWARSNQSEFIQDHISALIHKKSIAVDLSFYDSADYHNHLYRARQDASSRPQALLESAGSLLQNSITLLGMASILAPYGIWLPLVLLLSTLPAFYVVLSYNQRYHKWWERTTQEWRWVQHYDWMLTALQAAPEIRLFGLGDHFQSAYRTLRGRLRGERLDMIKRQSLARLGAGASALAISGAAMAWMVHLALKKLVTLGDLVLFYQAFQRGQALLRSLLGNLSQMYANSVFLGNLFEFLDLKPKIVDPRNPSPVPVPLRQGIRFRDVFFQYPGSKRAALQSFNLTIRPGQVVAIVGSNGAGKSTLVKLLCRFYDPTDGNIEWDGIDIRNFSVNEFRKSVSVLFQSSLQYQATVRENITFGDIASRPTQSRIEDAAQGAGAQDMVLRLPRGYDTLLGKWFAEGAELSGGEWQRLALARAFLRKAQLIILDEPTSAIDSWAEADWLDRFRDLAQGRTGIIITHRFTVAMRADLIHVMQDGKIVESGTHEELVRRDGLYAQSWAAQYQANQTIP
jgi:ATP-binding cassette subfamily B protein